MVKNAKTVAKKKELEKKRWVSPRVDKVLPRRNEVYARELSSGGPDSSNLRQPYFHGTKRGSDSDKLTADLRAKIYIYIYINRSVIGVKLEIRRSSAKVARRSPSANRANAFDV